MNNQTFRNQNRKEKNNLGFICAKYPFQIHPIPKSRALAVMIFRNNKKGFTSSTGTGCSQAQ